MKKYKVKDFEIAGQFTHSQLRGRENEYIYKIYWNGKDLGRQFTSKRSAQEWLSKTVKIMNAIIEKKERTIA